MLAPGAVLPAVVPGLEPAALHLPVAAGAAAPAVAPWAETARLRGVGRCRPRLFHRGRRHRRLHRGRRRRGCGGVGRCRPRLFHGGCGDGAIVFPLVLAATPDDKDRGQHGQHADRGHDRAPRSCRLHGDVVRRACRIERLDRGGEILESPAFRLQLLAQAGVVNGSFLRYQ